MSNEVCRLRTVLAQLAFRSPLGVAVSLSLRIRTGRNTHNGSNACLAERERPQISFVIFCVFRYKLQDPRRRLSTSVPVPNPVSALRPPPYVGESSEATSANRRRLCRRRDGYVSATCAPLKFALKAYLCTCATSSCPESFLNAYVNVVARLFSPFLFDTF